MLFFDHSNEVGDGDQVLSLLGGGKFTAVTLQRGDLSSSATGLAATKSCPAGQEFDTIDNVCRPAAQKFVRRSTARDASPVAPVVPAPVAPSVVAPSQPAPLTLVAPIPPPRSAPPAQAAETTLVTFDPAAEEVGFFDRDLVGPVKVKHALLGLGALAIAFGTVIVVRSGTDR